MAKDSGTKRYDQITECRKFNLNVLHLCDNPNEYFVKANKFSKWKMAEGTKLEIYCAITSLYNIYVINPTNILANSIHFYHERSQKLVGQTANAIYVEDKKCLLFFLNEANKLTADGSLQNNWTNS